MSAMQPLVSIIVAFPSDSQWAEQALRSCTEQTLADIEIICVANSPAAKTIQDLEIQDERVRIVAHVGDGSILEAHRAGVLAATAPYALFLRQGDELGRHAAAKVHRKASHSDADIVEFGFETMMGTPGVESASPSRKPGHSRLKGVQILHSLFPADRSIDTHLWSFAFRTELLRTVYSALPAEPGAQATDDLPVVLLAAATAETYVSFETPVYRHFPIRGTGGLSPIVGDQVRGILGTIDALDAVATVVHDWARNRFNPEPLADAHESSRLAMIGRALDLSAHVPTEARKNFIDELRNRVEQVDLVVAATTYAPTALTTVAAFSDRLELGQRPVRNILLTTNVLTTGGVSSVLLSQAHVLLEAGYRVTIATHRRGSDESMVPDGATLVEIVGSGTRQRLLQWIALVRDFEIDLVIDHRIMYSRDWPGYALAANAMNAATIGWIHAFSGRPTYNGNDLLSLLQDNLGSLTQLMVLSPLDVAFWKLRGIEHVSFLPNPPSSIILDSIGTVSPKAARGSRRLELVWWGRLDESTKKVTQLIEVAVALKRSAADFRLRIVGPEWAEMTQARLTALARKRGVDGLVEITGAQHGQDLIDTIDSSDIFINTSIIEGFLLTIPEAQSRGLPVVMYDLPWLLPVQENPGVISVPQGDSFALAKAVLEIASDSDRYEALSQASIDAARRAGMTDFADLYQRMVLGDLPAEYSPAPTMASGKQILDLLVFLSENRTPQEAGTKKASATGKRRAANAAITHGRNEQQTITARLERRLTAPGQRIVNRAPWLRPAARRIKLALLRG